MTDLFLEPRRSVHNLRSKILCLIKPINLLNTLTDPHMMIMKYARSNIGVITSATLSSSLQGVEYATSFMKFVVSNTLPPI